MALLDDEDKADIDEGLECYRKWKITKASIKKAEAEMEQDLALRWRRLEQELETQRLKGLEGLSAEVLIMAAKDPELRRLYHDQAVNKIWAQSTPDRIAAWRLGQNPELDNTLKDIILRMHDAGKLDQYEKLVTDLKEMRSEQKEDYERKLQSLMQMFGQVLGTAKNMASGG